MYHTRVQHTEPVKYYVWIYVPVYTTSKVVINVNIWFLHNMLINIESINNN